MRKKARKRKNRFAVRHVRKLTDNQVKQIRSSKTGQRKTAKHFKVSQPMIAKIRGKKTRTHTHRRGVLGSGGTGNH